MKRHHRTIVLALAALPGCFVFGQETADPAAAPAGDRVSSVWYSEQMITAVASSGDQVFAVTEQQANTQNPSTPPTTRALWSITRGVAHNHWQQSSPETPRVRIAVDDTSVYLVRPISNGLCEVDRFDKAALDSPPQVLCTLTPPSGGGGPDNYVCTPVGIALDGGQLFVATHNRTGPAYAYAPYSMNGQGGGSNDVTGTVWTMPTTGGPAAQVVSGRVFAAFYLYNVLVARQGQLYWAEGSIVQASQGQSFTSGAIAQSAQAAGSTPTTIDTISDGNLPTGLAASSAGVFYSTTAATMPQGSNRSVLSGCVIRTVASGASGLYSDSSNACSDLAADADSVYFPTVAPATFSPGNPSGPVYVRTQSIARVRIAGAARVGPIVVEAAEIDLTRLQLGGAAALLAIDPNVILSVPTSLLK
jgi:hypothetical protein